MNKFQVLVIDPPYGNFSDHLTMSDVKRGAKANYKSTMSLQEIKNLPIKEISDPSGALLALWVPSSLLQDGLDIMKSYGFIHKQTYIWVKTKKDSFKDLISLYSKNIKDAIKSFGYVKKSWKEYFKSFNFTLNNVLAFGLGRIMRQTHEICLIGINNNKIYKKLTNKSQRSVCFDSITTHSAKPEHLQNSLDLMFKGCKKIEIFGRRSRKDYLVIGNESSMTYNEDINISIKKLINGKEIQDVNSLTFDTWKNFSIE